MRYRRTSSAGAYRRPPGLQAVPNTIRQSYVLYEYLYCTSVLWPRRSIEIQLGYHYLVIPVAQTGPTTRSSERSHCQFKFHESPRFASICIFVQLHLQIPNGVSQFDGSVSRYVRKMHLHSRFMPYTSEDMTSKCKCKIRFSDS